MDLGLRERLIEVGWAHDDDHRRTSVFRWMQQATDRIEGLQREVESLQRVLDSRTAHLA